MAERTPALTPTQLRGEVALTRRRISTHVNGIEQDVTVRAQAVKQALPFAALTGIVSGSLLLALRRMVQHLRRD